MKFLKFNKSRISYKIFLTVSSVIFTLFLFSSWVSYSLVESMIKVRLDENLEKTAKGIKELIETSATFSYRSYLRAICEYHLEIIKELDSQVKSGSLTLEEAKQEAIYQLSKIKTGNSGYAYVINSKGIVEYHPYKNLQQEDLRKFTFINEQTARKEGFLQYMWKNENEQNSRSKILYMEYFKPWDWIVSVSAYIDELSQLVDYSDFTELIVSIKINKSGYPFIIDSNGTILIHKELQDNVSDHFNFDRSFLEHAFTNKHGKLIYSLKESGVSETTQKILAYETLDDMQWIVAATADVDEFYQPIELFKKLFIGLILLGFILSLIASYYLSTSITAPLKSLLNKLTKESKLLNIESPVLPDKNEIEEISEYFAEYVRLLHQKNKDLQKLLDEQVKTTLDLNIFKEIFENIVEGITITDKEGTIIQANPAFEKITGYSHVEALGQNPRILKSGKHSSAFYENMWHQIKEHGYWSGKIWNAKKDGELYPEWLTISVVKDKNGQICNYVAVFDDISELVQHQEKIQFLAYHDHLTGLPNRLMMSELIEKFLSEGRRKASKVICLICDLENFKTINDSMGQENGDKLLTLFVERLRPILRLEDVLGRIGGDEFVFLAKADESCFTDAVAIINRIFSAFTTPIKLQEKDIHVTLSIGVAFFPNDAEHGDELLKRAILALNNAEQTKGNSYRFFNPEMEEKVTRKINYLVKIREGLRDKEFLPYYQPKVNLATGRVVGMEALARWQSSNTLVPPGEFIPVAEESGLIIEMSEQLYEKSFAECVRLRAMGHDLKLSVNLSPIQLQSELFFDKFLEIQQASTLSPEHIELEITESVLFENIEYVQNLLKRITDQGFYISIDDFGTGYSSLQYLKRIHFDTLKIDMSFISGIGVDKDDEQLVRTIVILAKQFGMEIVAEGVEEKQQEDFLRQLGCDYGQGYYFSKPLIYDEFLSWLNQR